MFRFTWFRTGSAPLLTRTGGVGTSNAAMCSHGQRVLRLVLFGAYADRPARQRRVEALLPRCVAAQLLGALQATIRRDEGEEALQRFLEDVARADEEAARRLATVHNCCEAGFTTNGAEHTCDRAGGGTAR